MASSQEGTWATDAPEPPLSELFVQQEISSLTPLDAQLGVRAPKTVPDALAEALFGGGYMPQVNSEANPQTYALLDAAKLSFLPDILDTSGLRHDCLLQGNAALELKELSPWLVQLHPDHRLTRALLTDGAGPGDLWGRDLGVILRCGAPFEAVWRHLRRFVRLKRAEDGAWMYFRFWEQHVVPGLAIAPSQEPNTLAQALLAPIDGAAQCWVTIDARARRVTCLMLRDPASARLPVPPLHPATIKALTLSTNRAQMHDEIHTALSDVADDVRAAYGAEPGLADLWTALQGAQFALRAHRIDAIKGYLTLVFAGQQDAAWRILTQQDQGPTVRLWHLKRAMEDAA